MKRETNWDGMKFIAETDNDKRILFDLHNSLPAEAKSWYEIGGRSIVVHGGLVEEITFNR